MKGSVLSYTNTFKFIPSLFATILSIVALNAQAITNGTYQIKSACNNGKALDVNLAENGLINGTPLILWDAHGLANQQFKVVMQPDGNAKIIATHSGLLLDVFRASSAQGERIIQWEDNGGNNQLWRIEATDVAKNRYRLVAFHSGQVLDANMPDDNKDLKNGTKIMQWNWNGSCNQQWDFVPVNSPASVVDSFTATFQATDDTFANPERGLHDSYWISNSPGHTAVTDFSSARPNARTLIRAHVGLDEFKDKPISEARLNEVRNAFAKMRQQGVKAVPVFSYTFPSDNGSYGDGDAPLYIVKGHLDQLKPIFDEYKDVIALLANGFIGPWGEWHTSSNQLDLEPALSEVYNKLLEVFPKERMITARTVDQIRSLPGQLVNDATAYDQSKASRTGMTNLCFLASAEDAGTYYSSNRSIEENKQYWSQVSKHTVVGGETCNLSAYSSTAVPRDDCRTALDELSRMHFSYLNSDYYMGSLNRWKSEGCYWQIQNNLGYRFNLVSAKVQKSVKAGSSLATNFVVKNVGYAAPFNPRALSVVLRNTQTGARYNMSILQERSNTLDPRKWYRESGEITVSASPTVPADVPEGTYDVLLWLHDPMNNLSARPEYSIRFANKDVWDADTGMNKLISGVTITR